MMNCSSFFIYTILLLISFRNLFFKFTIFNLYRFVIYFFKFIFVYLFPHHFITVFYQKIINIMSCNSLHPRAKCRYAQQKNTGKCFPVFFVVFQNDGCKLFANYISLPPTSVASETLRSSSSGSSPSAGGFISLSSFGVYKLTL